MKYITYITVVVSLFILSACSNILSSNEKASSASPDEPILNTYLLDEFDGDIHVVYTNKSPNLVHEFAEDISIEIDEYQIVYLESSNAQPYTAFEAINDSYLITYKMTFTNKSDEDVSFFGKLDLISDDGLFKFGDVKRLVHEQDTLDNKEDKESQKFLKGKSYKGMTAHVIKNEEFQHLIAPTLNIKQPTRNHETALLIGNEAVFKIPVSEEGQEKAAISSQLYKDMMTAENKAGKHVFYEVSNKDKLKELDDIKIAVKGVQFAHILPSEAHAKEFADFGESEIIAMTIKSKLVNNSDKPVDTYFIERNLIINNRKALTIGKRMMEPERTGHIMPGKSGEFLTVYLFAEEDFLTINKISLEMSHLKSDIDIFDWENIDFENYDFNASEKTVTFKIPLEYELE